MSQAKTKIDRRDWSFAKRALAEIKPKPKKKQATKSHTKHQHHNRMVYWAIVELANGKRYRYQLSKDLQYAIKFDTPKRAIPKLIDSLMVVPLTDFYDHADGNYADMTVGRVLFVIKAPHTSKSRWITRGQFSKVTYNRWHWPNRAKLFNYLKHDYDAQSQQRIHKAIYQLIQPSIILQSMAEFIILLIIGLILWIVQLRFS